MGNVRGCYGIKRKVREQSWEESQLSKEILWLKSLDLHLKKKKITTKNKPHRVSEVTDWTEMTQGNTMDHDLKGHGSSLRNLSLHLLFKPNLKKKLPRSSYAEFICSKTYWEHFDIYILFVQWVEMIIPSILEFTQGFCICY